jgi:1-acyl-sn-glycerol-3-phosphate acyltransferase
MWILLIVLYALSIALTETAMRKLDPIIRYYKLADGGIDVMRRWDMERWSRAKFYVGSILLLPRLFLIIISVIAHWTNTKIIMMGVDLDEEKPITGIRRFLFSMSSKFWARVLLLGVGFWRVKCIGEPLNCSVIATNHCSWVDIIYFLTSPEIPSFVSKASVKRFPFIGTLASAMQCIFIERTKDKHSAINAIKDRQKILHTGFPKLLVFPEGTTTNGTGIMEFKRGGFIGLLPVQPICMEYAMNNFSPCMEVVPMWVHAVLLGSQFANELTVHRLPVVYPKDGQSPEELAEEVRGKISEHLKIPKVGLRIEEKVELLQKIFNEKAKEF